MSLQGHLQSLLRIVTNPVRINGWTRFGKGQLRPPYIILVVVMFLRLSNVCIAEDPLPHSYLEKIKSTPDFCQGDERYGNLPGHGDELCAPTAFSNSLIWLSQHGFPKIVSKNPATMAEQADLVRLLCEPDYFHTNLNSGTSPKQVVSGIEKFFHSKGYDVKIEQMGWRTSTHRLGKVPNEQWMLKSCMGSSNVLINIGWYKLNNNTFTRSSGHWITLVGFKEERSRHVLCVHDPSKSAGLEKKTEDCQLIPLPEHHFIVEEKVAPFSSDGYFELRGVHLKHGVDLAIIDEVVAFAPVHKKQ